MSEGLVSSFYTTIPNLVPLHHLHTLAAHLGLPNSHWQMPQVLAALIAAYQCCAHCAGPVGGTPHFKILLHVLQAFAYCRFPLTIHRIVSLVHPPLYFPLSNAAALF
jgi:hypothetical protein